MALVGIISAQLLHRQFVVGRRPAAPLAENEFYVCDMRQPAQAGAPRH
jgi:hypothetical protein